MSVAAWKGFAQLLTNPFYWEKTEHGLDLGGGAEHAHIHDSEEDCRLMADRGSTSRSPDRKPRHDRHGRGDPRPAGPPAQYVDPEVASHISEIPPEPRPFSADAPRAGSESGLIFAIFSIVYGVVGYFMLTDGRIVDFVSLQHLNEAYMVFWNDPPRLAAHRTRRGHLRLDHVHAVL